MEHHYIKFLEGSIDISIFFDKKCISDLIVEILPYPKIDQIKNDLVVKIKYGENNHNENYDMFMELLNTNNGKSKKEEGEKKKRKRLMGRDFI